MVIALIVLSGSGLLLFSTTSLDDVFITYWPAYSLVEFGELVNYNGERVEQSSSLVHVLLLAILFAVTSIPLPVLGYLVAIFSGLACIVVGARLCRQLNSTPVFMSLLVLATSPYMVYWSINSLEATLAALLSTTFVLVVIRVLVDRRVDWVTVPSLFLFVAIRPENVLLAGAALFGCSLLCMLRLSLAKGPCLKTVDVLRSLRTMTILLLGCFAFLTLFRLVYFGSLFPQPVTAKISGISFDRLLNGVSYLKSYGDWFWPVGVMYLLFAGMYVFSVVMRFLKAHKVSSFLLANLVCLMMILSYLGFIIFVGGDWMETPEFLVGRFFVPILPVWIIVSTTYLKERLRKHALVAIAVSGLLVFHIDGMLHFLSNSRGRPVWSEFDWKATLEDKGFHGERFTWVERTSRGHLRDIPVIETLEAVLDRIDRTQPIRIASHQAGMVPYHLSVSRYGQIEFIDLCGLTTRQFSGCGDLIRGERFQRFNNLGTCIPWDWFFLNQNELSRRCGVEKPDIIFDLGSGENLWRLLEKEGYHVVFRAEGYIREASPFASHYGPATSFVAVRRALLEDDVSEHILNWGELDQAGNLLSRQVTEQGTAKSFTVGVFHDGDWFLDSSGNGQFDPCSTDQCLGLGLPGDVPVTGDWNGSGTTKIGVVRDGVWSLDFNGDGEFEDCTTDLCIGFGLPGEIPVTGQWR